MIIAVLATLALVGCKPGVYPYLLGGWPDPTGGGGRLYDDFILTAAREDDDLNSLAARYLKDETRGWVIARFNGIQGLIPGQKTAIPLKPFGLGGLGAIGARARGAAPFTPTLRVVFWGAVAMASTAVIGSLVGRAV